MRYGRVRGGLYCVIALCAQVLLHAQGKIEASSSPHGGAITAVNIPFVGCRSDAQTEPLEAPKGTVASVMVDQKAAKMLAYYGSALDLGLLAPRGWYCLAINGSGGSFLFVSSLPIDAKTVFAPEFRGFEGSAIEISYRHGDQNGDNLEKARIIARAFPAYKAYAATMLDLYEIPGNLYAFGPYPSDRLTYKSKDLVEYFTPAQTEGLGTHSTLKKNSVPIEGLAMLSGEPPDVIVLSARLPEDLTRLAPVIVRQVEREFQGLPPRARGRRAPRVSGK